MRILKAGVLYFALVFGAGFVLGTIRRITIPVCKKLGPFVCEDPEKIIRQSGLQLPKLSDHG
jgi:hypothetical protein